MKRILAFALLSSALLISPACKKVEGPGGSSMIKGKINFRKYDLAGNIINEYPATEEDVYLIYGNSDSFFDDDVKTSYDGSFEFNYLQKGVYTVFMYEDCDPLLPANECPSGKATVLFEIEISEKKSVKDLGTINLRKE